jgi:Tfp pilus assembly protein PilN
MTRINLLPPEERAKAAREQGLALIVLALIVLVGVLGAVYVLEKRKVSAKEDKVTGVEQQIEQADRQVAALETYAKMEQDRSTMNEQVKLIYDARVDWSGILEEVSLVIPESVSLRSLTGVVPDAMQAGGGGQVAATTGTAATAPSIVLEGDAWSFVNIAEFMTRLGLLPQLENIRLANSTIVPNPTAGQPSTVTFEIDADLRPFATPPPTTTLVGTGQ